MDLKAGQHDDAHVAALLRDPLLIAAVPQESIVSLVEAAQRHGAVGLLVNRAAHAGVSFGAAWAPLRERAAGQSAAGALRDAEALDVLRRARLAGLPHVVLKGLGLAHSVYPQAWIRERGDTDVLIHERDVPRFDRLFVDLGYTLLPHLRGGLTLPQRHYHRDDSRGFRHAWDLHWRLTSSQALRFAVPEDELWTRAEPLAALEGARVPSRPDALLLACIHRLAHHFDDPRLIWLWDIRLLLEAMTPAEVEAFARLASRAASAAACGHSLAMAREHADAPIPDSLRPLLETSAGPAAFLWSGSRRPITYLIGELRAARRGDRGRLLRERLVPSLASMRERYPYVPTPLLPFAYAWRLAIGIPKWIRER